MVKANLPHESIQRMVQIIVRNIHPQKIILFGSYAHDNAEPDSDVDLLVVMNTVENKRKTAVKIYQLLAGSGLSKDIIVTTAHEIEKYKDTPGYIIQPALAEGITLYDSES